MKRGWMIAKCAVAGFLILIALVGVTMYLWNWLVPVLFAGPVITFWQALGLLVLSKILFSGKGCWHHKRHAQHDYGHWRHKLSSMTPEEREVLKKKLKDKWCQYDRSGTEEKSSSANE